MANILTNTKVFFAELTEENFFKMFILYVTLYVICEFENIVMYKFFSSYLAKRKSYSRLIALDLKEIEIFR